LLFFEKIFIIPSVKRYFTVLEQFFRYVSHPAPHFSLKNTASVTVPAGIIYSMKSSLPPPGGTGKGAASGERRQLMMNIQQLCRDIQQ
jgi:hypothetical protein